VSPAANCPRPEEFSALLDWELTPERLPTLERHIEECEKCREHYLKLAAADRMLGLSLGEVHLLAECLAVEPGEKDTPGAELVGELEAVGREERLAALREIARQKARRRRRLLIGALVVVVLLAGGFGAAVQPSPVKAISGSARRQASYIATDSKEPGEVTLCDGARVTLAPDTLVGFRCAWRWEQPRAELVRGRLTVAEGQLNVQAGELLNLIPAGAGAEASADGKVSLIKAP
jgi:hypothetical protein